MISIVCVYNDEKILRNWLLKSLENQTAEFELIKIDNTESAFKSAAEALNYGGKKARGKYIMFTHQDIFLLSNDWLEKAESLLENQMNVGIAGIAGMREIKQKSLLKLESPLEESIIGTVFHGTSKEPWSCEKTFSGPEEVQTLDELILIIPRRVFEKLYFDDKTCDDWHLYGVDYSLSVKRIHLKSYVLPLPVWHLSTGDFSKRYYKTLNKVLAKHKNYESIYTTSGFWHTNNFFNYLELFIMACKGEMGKWMGRNDHGGEPYMRQIKAFLT